jgi:hypothetical protein
MKNISPALGRLQIACFDNEAPLSDIGKARKELFLAIREALGEIALAATKDTAACAVEKMPKTNLVGEYLAKFDKLIGE